MQEKKVLELEKTALSIQRAEGLSADMRTIIISVPRKHRPPFVIGGFVLPAAELSRLGGWFRSYGDGNRLSLELTDSSHVLVTRDDCLDWFIGVPVSSRRVRHVCAAALLPDELSRLVSFFGG